MNREARPAPVGLAAALLVAVLFTSTSRAAEVRAEETDLLHFGFASQVGSGIYTVNGRTAQIYRIPVRVRLRSDVQQPWGLYLTLPVTLGFFDLSLGDFPDLGVREHIATASFTPGVEFRIPLSCAWTLSPFAEGGAARDFSSGQTTWVYAFGLASDVRFRWKRFDGRLGNRLVWAGVSSSDRILSDDYSELETGLELIRPTGWVVGRRQVDVGPFVASYFYFDPLEGVRDSDFELRRQWEAGVTFGTRPPTTVAKVRLPRVGLSVRFGDGVSAVRFILGAAF